MDPSGVFNNSDPTIQFGFEFSLGKAWSLQLEGGPLIQKSIWASYQIEESAVNHKGSRFGFELRHFVQEKYYSPFHGVYVGCNIYFLSNNYTDKTQWGTKADNPETYEYDYVNTNWRKTKVEKKEIGFTIRCGHQLDSKIPLGIELYTGLGFKQKTVNYTSITDPIFEYQVQIEKNGVKGAEDEGTYVRLSVPIGIRVVISL